MVNRITGVIGWIGTALIFAAVGIRFLRPDWGDYQWWATRAGLVCILIYFAGQWREIADFFKKPQAQYGTTSAVSVLVAIGILVAVNYLGVRQNKRWDFTENQTYSLSEQSVKIMQGLDAPLKFTAFDQPQRYEGYRDRLNAYDYESNNVTIELVDVLRDPSRAEAAQVTTLGTILIEYKGRTERVTSTEEQTITNALIKLVTGAEKKIYFTAGHGERDTTSSEPSGYATIVAALKRGNFGVEPLVIAQQKDIPADATTIIIAGPTADFLAPEIDALKKFVARGGKVMLMVDPPRQGGADLPNVRGFIKEWGIELGNDIVVDASMAGQIYGPSVPVAASYPAHAITDNFTVMTAFPLSRSVTTGEGGAGGRSAQPLVQTSPQSWAETNLKDLGAGGQVEFQAEQGDRQGPITLAAAVSAPATDTPAPPAGNSTPAEPADAPKPESRVVVFGDSDFVTNNAIQISGNEDFFMNAVNWAAQQENLIAIRPREAQDRRITMTEEQRWVMMLVSVFVIPGLVFAGGFYAWWRRR